MTKERRLAIESWTEIKEEFEKLTDEEYYESEDDPVSVEYMKCDFRAKHKVRWCADCWLCNYIPTCKRCPLSDGLNGCTLAPNISIADVPYQVVTNGDATRAKRIEACNTIISVLKGELDRRKEKDDWYFVERVYYVHVYDSYHNALAKARALLDRTPDTIIKGKRKFDFYTSNHNVLEVTE